MHAVTQAQIDILTDGFSPSFVPLPGLPSPVAPPGWENLCPKLLEYLLPPMRGEPSEGAPSAEASERRSPRLEGAKGGERRSGATGEDGPRLPAEPPVMTDDGAAAARDEVGEACVGLAGSEGPPRPPDSGDCWRSDGDGEGKDGDPEDTVGDLKAFTGPSGGRMGSEPADEDGS